MLNWNVPRPAAHHRTWFLWNLIVEAVVVIVRNEGATELLTSSTSGDGNPGPFYRRIGFVPTGDVDGYGEIILALDLAERGATIRTDAPGFQP